MSWVASAVVGGTVVSGVLQSNAAGDAADAQREGTAASVGEQRRQFDLTREDYAPFRDAGKRALTQLESDINAPVTSADVMSDPGYQFGLTQGQQALDRKFAAGGGRISGAALKSAARYGTDYASTGYNAAYQRRQDRLNRLAALAGVGQTATSGSAAAGANSANAISTLYANQGDANGAARLAQGNIWGNSVNQLSALGSRWAMSPSSAGSSVTNGQLATANLSSDPIGSLASMNGW